MTVRNAGRNFKKFEPPRVDAFGLPSPDPHLACQWPPVIRRAQEVVKASEKVRALARELKEIISRLDPLIETYTAKVCPTCQDVCCSQTNAYHDFADLVLLLAAGHRPPPYEHHRRLLDPCQFMGAKGCILPRWQRPYRCTWYFCSPLVEAMEAQPPKRYRRILAQISHMQTIRRELLETLQAVLKRGLDSPLF